MYFPLNQTVIKLLPALVGGLLLLLYSPAGYTAFEVTVLLSLPEKLQAEVQEQIESALQTQQLESRIYSISQIQQAETPSSDLVLAAGRDSCQYASENMQHNNVLCVLVSSEAFTEIRLQRSQAASDLRFAAIVLDQPIGRQIKVASRVFPSLKKFGVLASGQEYSFKDMSGDPYSAVSKVKIDQFNKDRAVAPQVAKALAGQDALVAIADKNVYSIDQLRTVLLTAYGYAKPVIGYSRAYVRAGALITTFTTPAQVFRQAVDMLESFVSESDSSALSIYDPKYFSIVDNPSIAKSLGLVRRFWFIEGHDYVDQDFYQ